MQPPTDLGPPVLVAFKVPASTALSILADADMIGATGMPDPTVQVGFYLPSAKAGELLADPDVMGEYRQFLME